MQQSFAFITPVYKRFSLTAICLQQRRWVCDRLRRDHGLDATCIVIGDDENLAVAADLGFETVEHANFAWHMEKRHVALGQKFNAGYLRAHRLGIDLVFPIGSDSWIDPAYFDTLPERGELLLSRAYNLIAPSGDRRGALWIGWEGGVQWISHVEDWAHRDYLPVSPSLAKGCDTSTWAHRQKGIAIREQHHHQLEYVAFQSPTAQITDYASIMQRYGITEVMGEAALGDLEDVYRHEDVHAVRLHYAREHYEAAKQNHKDAQDVLYMAAGEVERRERYLAGLESLSEVPAEKDPAV